MKIQNKDIQSMVKFLDTMNLVGRKSLGRTKLKEKLTKQNEVLSNDQKEIIEEFNGWTNKDKGQFRTDNPLQNEAMEELALQEIEITYNSPFRKDFVKALEDYDGELSGADADAYAVLYETLVEENEENNKEEK